MPKPVGQRQLVKICRNLGRLGRRLQRHAGQHDTPVQEQQRHPEAL